jgi:F-type H+-transporting ATPase subunit gamma
LARRSTRSEIFETGIKIIDELLDQLQMAFNQKRQTSIDEELFDVISGFEALADHPNRSG